MSEAYSGQFADRAGGDGSGDVAPFGAVNWLSLAATPTFAIMAVSASVSAGGGAGTLCLAAHDGSLLGGMIPMYVLMGAFHSAPWLKLIFGRRSNARRL